VFCVFGAFGGFQDKSMKKVSSMQHGHLWKMCIMKEAPVRNMYPWKRLLWLTATFSCPRISHLLYDVATLFLMFFFTGPLHASDFS
jgi:hypothetical protein